jgi:hypothetical protein
MPTSFNIFTRIQGICVNRKEVWDTISPRQREGAFHASVSLFLLISLCSISPFTPYSPSSTSSTLAVIPLLHSLRFFLHPSQFHFVTVPRTSPPNPRNHPNPRHQDSHSSPRMGPQPPRKRPPLPAPSTNRCRALPVHSRLAGGESLP